MSDPCWDQAVDRGRFRCTVEQTDADGYRGILRVTVADTDEVIHEQDVGVAYAARFGPDAADVEAWQEISLTAIDEWVAGHD